jgi:hypothetical protein
MSAKDRFFAWMRATATSADKEVLARRQQKIQAEMLQDIDVAIVQASQDQIAELKKGFKAMVDELNGLRKPKPENPA